MTAPLRRESARLDVLKIFITAKRNGADWADVLADYIAEGEAAARKAERERAANLVFELGPQLTSIGAPLWQKLGLAVRRMRDE